MIKTILFILLFPVSVFASLIDTSATTETQALYTKLQNAQGNYIYFGQHNFVRENSVSIIGTDYRNSDCYKVSGKLPYLMGMNWIVDENTFTPGKTTVLKIHNRQGGFCMMTSIPERNLVTDGGAGDLTGNPVHEMLPGGSVRTTWLAILDNFYTWCTTEFLDDKGNLIPLIIRPFHEMDGNWFWWGRTACSDADYISLWQDMVTYLRDTKGLHNLIWCYSPDWKWSQATSKYPGDAYVDIIVADCYDADGTASNLMTQYGDAYDFATLHNKIYAIAEGLRNLVLNPLADFWTTYYSDLILADSKASNAAFIAVWSSPTWSVSDGGIDAPSFLTMSQNPKIKMLQYHNIIGNSTWHNSTIGN
jgi:hypothetical protein